MPVLNNFCRCASLKSGTVFAGVVGILAGFITLILILVTNVKFQTIIIDTLPSSTVKIIIAINLFMTILISLLLIYGALKKITFLMIPWIVLAIMLALGLLVSVLYTSISLYIHGDSLNGTLWLVFGIIFIVLYVYMWFVVFSYYQYLQEEAKRGPYMKSPYRR